MEQWDASRQGPNNGEIVPRIDRGWDRKLLSSVFPQVEYVYRGWRPEAMYVLIGHGLTIQSLFHLFNKINDQLVFQVDLVFRD